MTLATDLSSVIQKEALYCALGRCTHRLKNEIPFDQWLQHTLSVEAKEPNNPRCAFSFSQMYSPKLSQLPDLKETYRLVNRKMGVRGLCLTN